MKTLPEDFRTYTQALMGEKLYQRLEHAILEEEAPTSIRINPFKCKDAVGEPIPWCPETGWCLLFEDSMLQTQIQLFAHQCLRICSEIFR